MCIQNRYAIQNNEKFMYTALYIFFVDWWSNKPVKGKEKEDVWILRLSE